MAPHEDQIKQSLLQHFKKLIRKRDSLLPALDISFHLGFFNEKVYPIVEVKEIELLEPTLHPIEFKGQTALYDAMGFGIDYLKSLKRKGTMLLVVLTDGHENTSTNYSENEINNLLDSDSLKAYLIGAGWNLACSIEKYPIYEMIIHQTTHIQIKEIFSLISEIYKNISN